MIDFATVAAQMEQMLDARQGRRAPCEAALGAAHELCNHLSESRDFNAQLLAAKNEIPPNWHPAALLNDTDAPADSASSPPATEPYRVVASDGSQIYPDAHQISDCYLLHISRIDLRYGNDGAALMDALPSFCYGAPDDEWFNASSGGATAAGRELVDARRHVAEVDALAALLEEETTLPTIGLTDGIFDLRVSAQHAWRDHAQNENNRVLDRLRATGQPVAGYIAASRATDVVTSLRVLRRQIQHNGQETEPDEVDLALSTLPDVRLFDELLPDGARSPIFVSQRLNAGSGNHPGSSAGTAPNTNGVSRHQTCFFYLKFEEGEVARLEFPIWIAGQSAWIERIHGVVLAQVERGSGYPIALMEAHEHAVVRASEREAFYLLLEELMLARGLAPRRSSKSRSKSRPLV